MKLTKSLPLWIITSSLAVTLPGNAELIFGLEEKTGPFPTFTPFNVLFTFDSASPGVTTNIGNVTGVVAGQTLVGMDFRPATKELVAMSYNEVTNGGYLYKVNILTGALTQIGTGFTIPLAMGELAGEDDESQSWAFDFNPVADLVRAINKNNENGDVRSFRLNPITGAFVLEDTKIDNSDAVFGIAYSNNVAGATSTTLFAYNDDGDLGLIGGLGGVPSPNLGQFFSIGNADFSYGFDSGLDISGVTGVGYAASSDGLYTFETSTAAATGEFTKVGSLLGRSVIDISVDPVVPIVFYLVDVEDTKLGKVTGEGSFVAGSTVKLKAKPKKGSEFLGWFEDGKRISTKLTLKIRNLAANRSLTAKFQ